LLSLITHYAAARRLRISEQRLARRAFTPLHHLLLHLLFAFFEAPAFLLRSSSSVLCRSIYA